jgi:uncharacterized membrane protein
VLAEPTLAAQWLLAFHITGAFLFLGGAVAAGVLNALAWRAERPSEIALFLRLVRFTVPVVGIGSLLALVLGLWLVHRDGFSYGDFWVWGAVVLWVLAQALGGRGGRMQAKAREEAERCAAEGDVSTARLRELLRDPAANALSYASGVAILLVLVLMIWKPGS